MRFPPYVKQQEMMELHKSAFTFDSQLLYRMGRHMALSLSILGKCFRATRSMFSSVQCLSSSSTSLHERTMVTRTQCNYYRWRIKLTGRVVCSLDISFQKTKELIPAIISGQTQNAIPIKSHFQQELRAFIGKRLQCWQS